MNNSEQQSKVWGVIQESFSSGIEEIDLYSVFDSEEGAREMASQLNSTNKDTWLPDASKGTAYFVRALKRLGKISAKVIVEYEDEQGNIFNRADSVISDPTVYDFECDEDFEVTD